MPELAQHVGPVGLHGLLRQVEDARDLGVGEGLGDQLDHLLLARRERDHGTLGAVGHPLADDRALGGVGQERLAAADRADGSDQVLVGLALEHIARRARLQRLEHVVLVVVHGENQHAHSGELGADLACGLETGHPRHADVEDAQVGLAGQRLLHRLDSILGLRDHVEVGLALEQELDPRPDDPVVVGYEHSHGRVSSTRVPCGVGARDRQLAADEQRPLAHARHAESAGALDPRSRGRRR